MVLSPALTNRLEDVWIRLQRLYYVEGISQIDLDEKCILALEQYADVREDEPVAAGVVCKCPADFCPAHGKLDKSEMAAGRKVRG